MEEQEAGIPEISRNNSITSAAYSQVQRNDIDDRCVHTFIHKWIHRIH